jgi:4-amino-4-deoxy-L-arabinose transferase-like glycosyltransferase
MNLIKKYLEKIWLFFCSMENIAYAGLSISLAVIIFILERNQSGNPIFHIFPQFDKQLNFLFFSLFVISIGAVLFFSSSWNVKKIFKKFIIILFPSVAITFYALYFTPKINPWIIFSSFLYATTFTIYLLRQYYLKNKDEKTQEKFKIWFKKQGTFSILIITAVMAVNLFFGLYNIGKFAAVDEALWTFDRVPGFWNALKTANWNGARVSDKPGLTVALATGAGLLFENPAQFENMQYDHTNPQDTEKFNFSFRMPLYLLTVLLLPFFYFFIEKFSGKNTALFSIIFIGLSPPLIGMSRIVNPDSLLWIFMPLSVFSYFAYLEKGSKKYLYASGFLLGLSLLTKYIANVLYVYFFLVIFLEYITNKANLKIDSAKNYFKKSLADFGILSLVSILTLYALYPAVWAKPQRVLIATIQSQAFSSTWPLFASLLFIFIFDLFFLKGRVVTFILEKLEKYKKIIYFILPLFFLICIFFALANTYGHMKFFDFESILTSPKSSYAHTGFIGTLAANFYPLVFGVIPLVLILIIWISFKTIRGKSSRDRFSLYIIALILIYYIGSVINHIASNVRYQIVIFPLALVLAALGASSLVQKMKLKENLVYFSCVLLFIASGFIVYLSFPFNLSYASSLLPKQYYLDVKDMGTGSYEAASFLNNLPDAQNLVVWTDKSGVCSFFVGKCLTGLDDKDLNASDFNYVVLSSGRENRTTNMLKSKLDNIFKGTLHIDDLYSKSTNDAFLLEVNNRPSQFVKIIKISL